MSWPNHPRENNPHYQTYRQYYQYRPSTRNDTNWVGMKMLTVDFMTSVFTHYGYLHNTNFNEDTEI